MSEIGEFNEALEDDHRNRHDDDVRFCRCHYLTTPVILFVIILTAHGPAQMPTPSYLIELRLRSDGTTQDCTGP